MVRVHSGLPFQLLRNFLGGNPGTARHYQSSTNLQLVSADAEVDNAIQPTGAAAREMFPTNLIMPEPRPFISTSLPACWVVRPTNTTMTLNSQPKRRCHVG